MLTAAVSLEAVTSTVVGTPITFICADTSFLEPSIVGKPYKCRLTGQCALIFEGR